MKCSLLKHEGGQVSIVVPPPLAGIYPDVFTQAERAELEDTVICDTQVHVVPLI